VKIPLRTIRTRLNDLEAEASSEAYFFGRVCLDGEDPAELAKLFGESEAEVSRRAEEAIRKLNPERPVSKAQ